MWQSEYKKHLTADQDIKIQIAGMKVKTIQLQIDAARRQMWEQQDRNIMRPTQSGKDREREIEQQIDRLEEDKKEAKENQAR